jgi:hypothetical protein
MHSRTSESNSTGKRCARAFLLRRLTRFQDLFHGVQQAVGIEQHELVELAPLRFFHLAPLQGFEVEADGGDRRLQFVGDGVDEAVVLLVAANFADQKNRIEDEAGVTMAPKK